MSEVLVALISGILGGGLGSLLTFYQKRKSDSETWENWRRGGYGGLLDVIDEYRSSPDADKWRASYRGKRSRVLMSGAPEVVELLLSPTLADPAAPDGSKPLLDEPTYRALVEAMRADVVPHAKKPKGAV
jgi:hypothetical protein